MHPPSTPAGRDDVKKALQAAIQAYITANGLRLIRGSEEPEPGLTAELFNINTRTGKAIIELHQPWNSRGKQFTTAVMKIRAADNAGVSYWSHLSAGEKKSARAKWCVTVQVIIQL